jgi:hypothetical protein
MALPLICNKFKPATVKIAKYLMKFPKSELVVALQVLNIPQNVGPNEKLHHYVLVMFCLSFTG